MKIYDYVTSLYSNKNIRDIKLLNKIKKIKPKYLIINLGGGNQEILGSYLKNNLNYKLSIICTEAATAYFTKEQAPPQCFFDRIYLGWLIRIIFNPFIFFTQGYRHLNHFFS